MPSTSHTPAILDVLQEHADMIAEHGHSHGLEEDILWATHGHSHDSIDHDHSQAVVPGRDLVPHAMEIYRAAWRLSAATSNILRIYQIERPPRV
ncbi:hypothetical protein [Pseudosulfitobacter koreensis]|uniref:Uncharacterized protein n=1 Tax=Pseudosulfitobacter koreensis TaxID=2968472 RepID=A0ABT1YWN4_9RHOB|nr:hypothetical protein [Pseudosulfitobacter koreense]MCR8825277.1 hypothetical protein [Pseudosulfitobacter koreense]